MPSNATALLPAGLLVGHIPGLSVEDQAIAGFFSTITNPSTKRLYRASLDIYLAWCERQEVDVMTARPVQLRLYLTWLTSVTSWSEATRSRLFGVVSVFYKRALIDELILRDPTLGIKRPKVDKGKQRRTWLPPLEMIQFLKAAGEAGPQQLAMVMLLSECALRAAEACSVRIEHMDHRGGKDYIRFIGKNSKAATMALQPTVGEAVRAAIGDRTFGTIIVNTAGDPYTPNNLWRLIKRLARDAGLDPEDVSPHTLRRSCARTATMLGVPVHQTQALLRHEDIKTTMLYIGDDTGMEDLAGLQVSAFYSSLLNR